MYHPFYHSKFLRSAQTVYLCVLCGVYSAVRAEYLNNLSLYCPTVGRAVAKAVSSRPLIAEARVRSHFSPCEICSGQSSIGEGFSSGTSVFPCQYHSTGALYSFPLTHYSYRKDKRSKPGNLPKKAVLFRKSGSIGYKTTFTQGVISPPNYFPNYAT